MFPRYSFSSLTDFSVILTVYNLECSKKSTILEADEFALTVHDIQYSYNFINGLHMHLIISNSIRAKKSISMAQCKIVVQVVTEKIDLKKLHKRLTKL